LRIVSQSNKERRAIHFGPPPNLKELEIMFEKSKEVSGLSACIPGQGEPRSPINLEDINIIETHELEELSHMKENGRRGEKRKGLKSPNKKVKNPMVQVLSKMVDDAISTISVTSKVVQGDFRKDEISEAIKLAKEVGATEGRDEHYIATSLFVKSKNRVVFMTL
jgi:predicted ATP-dependent endonuclease of OLD family